MKKRDENTVPAVPMTLIQELEAYKARLQLELKSVDDALNTIGAPLDGPAEDWVERIDEKADAEKTNAMDLLRRAREK